MVALIRCIQFLPKRILSLISSSFTIALHLVLVIKDVSAPQLFHCTIVVELDFIGMTATNDEKKSLLQHKGSISYMLPFFITERLLMEYLVCK